MIQPVHFCFKTQELLAHEDPAVRQRTFQMLTQRLENLISKNTKTSAEVIFLFFCFYSNVTLFI